jgi:PTS system nitrogen regulatory IIA component
MLPSNLLSESRVCSQCEITSKKRLLETLAALLTAGRSDLTTESVFERLTERERLGATGLGHGIALPHARMKDIERPIGAFVRGQNAVSFDALDDQPVDLAFALLVPEHADETHLQILSGLAQMFADPGLRARLRAATDDAELFAILTAAAEATDLI